MKDLWGKMLKLLEGNLGGKPKGRYTAREIVEWIYKNYPKERKEKMRQAENIKTKEDFIQQYSAQVSATWANHMERKGSAVEIKRTTDSPQRYYCGATSSAQEEQASELKEKDLYPLLAQYAREELCVYCKRIVESKGPKGAKNSKRWLHPDLVGIQSLVHDWGSGTKQVAATSLEKKARLWSFEVKLKVETSNLREAFFQTVSNSSWAHFGYMVVGEKPNNELINELRILSGVHGIGVIKLDASKPANSQILIPAKERADVDWNTANKLIVNPDFEKYVELLDDFNKINKINEDQWD